MALLPAELLDSLTHTKGFDKGAFEKVHADGEQVTSVRINPLKWSMVSGQSLPAVQAGPIEGFNHFSTHNSYRGATQHTVPWCPYGFYLAERPSFTLDPLLHAGAYYVQEASSMFLFYLMEWLSENKLFPEDKIKVLDLCAAPGGKTTLLSSLSFVKLVLANEIIKSRSAILYENVVKWGAPNIFISNNDPKNFKNLTGYFDALVIDAPCSGSGLFRKDPDAIKEWNEDNVKLCSQRQQRIIADAYDALKQDGILIYSTCSYSKEEDEEILDWICENFLVSGVQVILKEDFNICEVVSDKHQAFGYRFWPDKIKGEGFFIACFKKKDGASQPARRTKKTVAAPEAETAIAAAWLKTPGEILFDIRSNEIFAFPSDIAADYNHLSERLNIRKGGVRMGSIIKNELVPDHELAVNAVISGKIASLELDKEQSLQFLRKENLSVDTALKGWAHVKYGKLGLGFVKLLGNRINNYYPAAWRILKP